MNYGGYSWQGTLDYYELTRMRRSMFMCLSCKKDIIMQHQVHPKFCPHCGSKFGEGLINSSTSHNTDYDSESKKDSTPQGDIEQSSTSHNQ